MMSRADFPLRQSMAALAGATPKLAVVRSNGRYLVPGQSECEQAEQFEAAEEVARDLADQIARRPQPGRSKLILSALRSLRVRDYAAEKQNLWIVGRVAEILQCDLPPLPPPSDAYTLHLSDEVIADLMSRPPRTELERGLRSIIEEVHGRGNAPNEPSVGMRRDNPRKER
jgi:hypothetical protein